MHKCEYWKHFKNNKNSSKSIDGQKIKSGFLEKENVFVWIIAERDKNLLKSSKLFKKTMAIYGEMAEPFLDYYLDKIRAHSHTLRSIQGKMKQKIDSLARKKDFRGRNYSESKQKIEEIINKDREKAADLFCYLNKRVAEIDAHIEGFEVLYMGNEKEVKTKEHNLKKVLQNIIAPSLEDFEKKYIDINFHIRDNYAENNMVFLDYKLTNLAFVNFFDNAVKYSKPDSSLDIYFEKENEGFTLRLEMLSLRIESEEKERIFEEKYTGVNTENEAGDGIGMYVIKKSLGMMNINVCVEPNYSICENFNNKQYIKNIFIFNAYEI